MTLKHFLHLDDPDIPKHRGDLYDTDFFQMQKGSVPVAHFSDPTLLARVGGKREVSRKDSPTFQSERETAPELRLRHFRDFATAEPLPCETSRAKGNYQRST